MADKRIIELTNEAMNHSNDDYLAVDSSSSGTRKIKADALLAGVAKQADLAAETAARKQDVADLKADLEQIFSDNAKEALLNCFQHVAWTDEHGQDYYDALESVLFENVYPKIIVVYAPGGHIVFTDDTLDTLKQYITVTYYESVDSVGVTIPSTDYALDGTLTEGTSIITASYESVSAKFNVQVVDFDNMSRVVYPSEIMKGHIGNIYYASGNQSITTDETTTIRYFIGVTRGVKAIREKVSGSLDIYPVPIPSGVTSVTITMPGRTDLFCGISSFEWNGTGYANMQSVKTIAYVESGTADLSNISNKYLTFVFGLQDNVEFTDVTKPQSVIIEFN